MNKNKQMDMTPYNMGILPKRQSLPLMPLIWGASYILTGGRKFTAVKTDMEGLKPPYLVLSMHQGFSDYFITPRALFPNRATYVSDVEGFANYGNTLYSKAGCIATRRFVNNVSLVKNIRHVIENNKDILVIFPEARHSNAGTSSPLPPSTGKLIKLLRVPVVAQKLHGSYLASPIWDEQHRRKVPLESTLEYVLTPEEIERMPAKDITALMNRHFEYDEYQWQYENQIVIDYPKRAEGLHKILYLCPACGREYETGSSGHTIFCNSCGKKWEMDFYGRLHALEGDTEFSHIPHWYEYQRGQVIEEIKTCRYRLKLEVNIEALPNEKGFVPLGTGVLEHTFAGFFLTFQSTGETKKFLTGSMPSVHTEYNYRNKGDCLVLSTKDCCYYLYPVTGNIRATKTQFAAEAFWLLGKKGL